MKKETKKVAKRMKEDPKPQKGSRRTLKKLAAGTTSRDHSVSSSFYELNVYLHC